MGTRTDLHNIFKSIPGLTNVYFQPPENVKMAYPCIKYDLDGIEADYANNKKYIKKNKYLITLIEYSKDSQFTDVLLDLPNTRFDRKYTSDNLHHTVISIYY